MRRVISLAISLAKRLGIVFSSKDDGGFER